MKTRNLPYRNPLKRRGYMFWEFDTRHSDELSVGCRIPTTPKRKWLDFFRGVWFIVRWNWKYKLGIPFLRRKNDN
jgi:hypothetical protein